MRALARREAPWIIVAAAVVLALPALWLPGGIGDDWLALAWDGHPVLPVERSAIDLFSWLPADAAAVGELADRTGMWTLADGARLRVWRPLTSITHALDAMAWPHQIWAIRLHGLLWYGLAALAIGALYRTFFGSGWIAPLALAVFALDDARAVLLADTLDRHQVVGAGLTALTLLLHHRWRRDGWQQGRWLAPACFAASLLASETAIAGLGYVLAYTIAVERAPGPQQWGAFAPYAALAATWFIGCAVAGFDVTGIFVQPVAALAALVLRSPLLAAEQLGVPGFASVVDAGTGLTVAVTIVGASLAVLVGWTIVPLLQRNSLARFWALGALLAMPPAAWAGGGGGSLIFVALGASALIAQYLAAIWRTAPGGRLTVLQPGVVVLGGLWLIAHLVVAPALLPWRIVTSSAAAERMEAAAASLPADAALADQQLVIVHAPDLARGPGLLVHRAARSAVLPASARVLAFSAEPLTIVRTAEDAVAIDLAAAPRRVPWPAGRAPLAAALHATLGAGSRVEIDGFEATVVHDPAEDRWRADFRFDVPCDNESLRWIAWDGERYVAFTPPAVGERAITGAAAAP